MYFRRQTQSWKKNADTPRLQVYSSVPGLPFRKWEQSSTDEVANETATERAQR